MWTVEQKLAYLMTRPWTVAVSKNDEEGYLIARVAEIPDALATGADERELGRDLYESLRASLAARLEFGDAFAVPQNEVLPWDRGEAPPPARPQVRMKVAKTDTYRSSIEYAAA